MANPPCNYCGSTAGPEHPCPAKLIGQILDGRYQIESVLGQGGMGMVFTATQVAVRRQVALKTLHPSLAAAPQFFERFRREAEVASRLNHPNIITVFDFGKAEDGTCYFVMELVSGESLKQLVKREGPLSLRRAANIIEQCARGLAHAHAENAVHRDIKPHNLLISQVDGADFVKILDFGLVKAMEVEEEEQLTSTGQVLGTPQYMPPEQAGGEMVDARSDLYSLGGVLYFCLTGTSPYGANNVRKALTAALTQQVPPVESKRHGAPVPPALDDFFRKALAAEKDDRHQSAEEFLQAMHAALAGCTDAELEALPTASDGATPVPSKPGRSSQGSGSSRSRGSASKATPNRAASGSSRASNVVVDPRALSVSKARPGTGSRSAAPPPPEELAPISAPKVIVAVAALVLFVVGGAVAISMRKSDPPPPAPVAVVKPAPAPTPAPAPDAPPAQSAMVTVRVTSEPEGAEVLVGDEVRGATPVEIPLARGHLHEVTVRLAGFQPETKDVDLTRYGEAVRNVDVKLQPKAVRATPPGPGKKKKGEDIPVFE